MGATQPKDVKEGDKRAAHTAARVLCVLLLFWGDNPTEAQQAQIQVNTFARCLLNHHD